MGFGSGLVALLGTIISMSVPVIVREALAGSSIPGLTVQFPYFDSGLILGLAVLAGAFAFAEKMTSDRNPMLGGTYGIIRYAVSLYYTVTLLAMIGTIVIPAYNITILTTYLLLGTLIIAGIVFNMIAYLTKIAAAKEFTKKRQQ